MPGLAAIIGALNDLSEPATGLRNVDAIGIHRRTFHVIHLPPSKMRAADLPVFALAVGSKNERAFARAYQHPDFAHA